MPYVSIIRSAPICGRDESLFRYSTFKKVLTRGPGLIGPGREPDEIVMRQILQLPNTVQQIIAARHAGISHGIAKIVCSTGQDCPHLATRQSQHSDNGG